MEAAEAAAAADGVCADCRRGGPGDSIDAADTSGAVAAARSGHMACLRAAFQRNPTLRTEARGDIAYTPLIAATENGHLDAVQLLLEEDAAAQVALSGDVGWKALHYAADGGHGGIVKALLQHTPAVQAGVRSDFGQTPLMCGAHALPQASVKELLKHMTADQVRIADIDGHTALYLAAGYGHAPVVHTLLTAGAKASEAMYTWNGGTTLDTVVSDLAQHAAMPQALQQALAPQQLSRSSGCNSRRKCTTLFQAAERGCSSCVQTLLSSGAEVSAKDIDHGWPWRTALGHAASGSHAPIVRQLLIAGAKASGARSDQEWEVVDEVVTELAQAATDWEALQDAVCAFLGAALEQLHRRGAGGSSGGGHGVRRSSGGGGGSSNSGAKRSVRRRTG